MRRRLLTAAAAPLAAVLLAAGCSGSADTPADADPKTPPTAGEPTAAPALEYPAKARALVPETSGAGSRNLPVFTPDEETYTLYADCTGKGAVTLVDWDDPDGEPHPIVCDGVSTVGSSAGTGPRPFLPTPTPRAPRHPAPTVPGRPGRGPGPGGRRR
ncbi:hypothetical protein [Streptomyces sp. ScaeMP-e83]|uniref:hypothetical protein n=1 Tax=Streptomyces sp. ScaeMP-e83 TaxID=1758151 RepID=UPI00081EBA77|nr:hypothetical protein [Streptomyces sp. ScaeMP-e83]SCD53706.1 hypothetical protein GA0115243_102666 [Streptomyces sp. ScaeMP-e83]